MTDGQPTLGEPAVPPFHAAPGDFIIAPPAALEEPPPNEGSHPRYSLAESGLYFLKLGTFGFGGPIALVGYMQRDLVERRQWVSQQDYREGLALAQLAPGPLAAQLAIYLGWVRGRALGATLIAVAMITPGPVVITVAFIGYLVAGVVGAAAAALGVFLPCYLLTVIPAPHFRRWAQNRQIRALVDGVTAAATGAIAGAAVVLGRRAIVDLFTAAMAVGTWLLLTRFRKVPEPVVILLAGVLGITILSIR